MARCCTWCSRFVAASELTSSRHMLLRRGGSPCERNCSVKKSKDEKKKMQHAPFAQNQIIMFNMACRSAHRAAVHIPIATTGYTENTHTRHAHISSVHVRPQRRSRHTSITLNTQPSFPGTPSTAHGVNRVTPPPPSTIEQRSSHITSLLLSPLIQEQRSTPRPAEREASSIHALSPRHAASTTHAAYH